jgi:hypothetical protein
MNNSKILNLIEDKKWDIIIENVGKSINPFSPIDNGNSVLHYIVINNQTSIFDLLQKKIKDLDKFIFIVNNEGDTIAHIAAKLRYKNFFFKIINLNPRILNVENYDSINPLFIIGNKYEYLSLIIKNFKKEIIENIININSICKKYKNLTLLTWNIIEKKKECIDLLINFIINNMSELINGPYIKPFVSSSACSNIHFYANNDIHFSNNCPLIVAALSDDNDTAKLLIDYGCKIDPIDVVSYKTPLFVAIDRANVKLVELLLSNGANCNYSGVHNMFKLMDLALFNCSSEFYNKNINLSKIQSYYHIIKLLLSNNINLNILDTNMYTSTHLMLRLSYNYRNYIKQNKENNIVENDIIVFDNNNLIEDILPLEIKREFIKNTNLISTNKFLDSVLHYIIIFDDWKNYKDILLKKKINAHQINKFNESCIILIKKNHPDELQDFYNILTHNYINILKKNNKLCKNIETDKCYNIVLNEIITKNKLNYRKLKINKTKKDHINIPYYGRTSKSNYFNPNIYVDCIFLPYLIDKFKNCNIPYIIDKNNFTLLKTTFNNELAYNITFELLQPIYSISPYILPTIIFWFDENNYFFHPEIKKACKLALRKNQRFLIFILNVKPIMLNEMHANILLYDTVNNTIERFDPHGVEENSDIFDNSIEDNFKKIFSNDIKYLSPKKYLDKISFQGFDNTEIKNITDLEGYCTPWCYLYLELRLLNPDVEPSKLMKKSINRIKKLNISFRDYIKNYAGTLTRVLENTYSAAGIDDKFKYESQPNIISKTLLSKYLYKYFLRIQYHKIKKY